MDYFLALVMNGLLSGSVYALVGMAFVVVYRASTVLNFSLGEWVSLGAKATGVSVQVLGLPILPAVAAAIGAVIALAIAFNRIVIRKLIGRPVVCRHGDIGAGCVDARRIRIGANRSAVCHSDPV